MRFLTIAAIVLALFIFGPSLFAVGQALRATTVEVIHGPSDADVDISMMPEVDEALFEKNCGRQSSPVEFAHWFKTADCPKDE